jgi:hypothetical protein
MSSVVDCRRGVAALVLLLLALSGFLASPARASARNQAEQFVDLANQSRDAAGMPEYVVAADLSEVAVQQAARMADAHNIFHNPNLKTEVADWYMVGENVGVGSSPHQIHDAFMASPTHRADLLSADFEEIGVGLVVGDDRRLYVSEVFRLREERSATAVEPDAAPQPQPPVAPTPAPASTPAPTVPVSAPVPVTVPVPVTAPTSTSTSTSMMTTTTSIMLTTPSPTAMDAHDQIEIAMARRIASTSRAPAPPQLGTFAASLAAAALAIGVLCLHLAVLRRASIS